MSEKSTKIKVERQIAAEPALVYQYLTNSTALREWFADTATLRAQPGGHYFVAWNDGYYAAGEFKTLQKPEQISFTWDGKLEPGATHVNIHLATANGGTHVTVEHSGVGAGEEWAGVAGEFQKGWEYGLNNLASVLETGQDLRFTRRPMLGIIVGDYNADIAAKLGVPVQEGIRLDNVVPEMGAGAAGLQADDVVVGIDDVTINDWASLNAGLGTHQAGDTVQVTYYRGGEKRETDMTLSSRPLPEMPQNPVELAAVARRRYAGVEENMDSFLSEIGEAEAAYRPGPAEWSVKDILAHLIHGERGFQQWVGNLVGGHEGLWDDWGGNMQCRNDALLAVYSGVPALNQELKRSHQETIALLANLPDAFLKRKNSFWRVAYVFADDSVSHEEMHMEQMQAAVNAARQQ
jgi:uncharacterized protein YndB with AHSA1/START domain